MQNDLSLVVFALLCVAPVVLVVMLIRRRVAIRRSQTRTPFAELKRRQAGESLRIKLQELDERINDRVLLLMGLPFALALMILYTHPQIWVFPVTLVCVSTVWALIIGKGLVRLTRERSNYQLGFDGERYVGEEPSRLAAEGFEIYHDVPFDGFNIDHVLVGTAGVFAIETKTRRKPVDESGDKEYRVVFDGQCLQWPWGAESHGIEQAFNNAQTLSKWLTSAVGDRVDVSAILTLPDWMVERKAPGARVNVLNPKEIIQACGSTAAKLDQVLVRRICHQLDQKCRVEVK